MVGYSAQQRQHAIDLALADGVNAASRATGVTSATISNWLAADRQTAAKALVRATTAHERELARLEVLRDKALGLLEQGMEASGHLMERAADPDAPARDVQALVSSWDKIVGRLEKLLRPEPAAQQSVPERWTPPADDTETDVTAADVEAEEAAVTIPAQIISPPDGPSDLDL